MANCNHIPQDPCFEYKQVKNHKGLLIYAIYYFDGSYVEKVGHAYKEGNNWVACHPTNLHQVGFLTLAKTLEDAANQVTFGV